MVANFSPPARAVEPDRFAEQFASLRPSPDAWELAEVRRELRARLLDRRSAPLRIERYEILRFIGVGGHGCVYEAFDPKLDRRVAIKILRSVWEGDAEESRERRLLDEARAIARTSDPRIVAVHDVARCPAAFLVAIGEKGPASAVFMVMEYVEGVTLRQWLQKKPRHPADIIGIFQEAATGLLAAHRRGVVHGDFKPENVMITADDHVKLLDFGIARTARLGSAPNRFMGTLGYASPEQCRGEAIDEKSDQYSFCRALEEALRGARASRTRARDVEKPTVPAPPSRAAGRVLQAAHRIARRGLAISAADRFDSMELLASELERTLNQRAAPFRSVLTAFVAVVILATLATGGVAPAPASSACVTAKQSSVWNPERASRLERAFSSTALPYAADSWRSVARELESYGARLGQSAALACKVAAETIVRPGEVGGARGVSAAAALRCLEERRRAMGSLLDVMEERPKDVLPQVVEAVFSLRPPAACLVATGERDFSSSSPMPDCAARLESELYTLDAELTAATFERGVARSAAAREAARTCARDRLGPWSSVVHGLHLLGASQPEPASTVLRAAFLEAETAGDSRIAMRAMIGQIVAYGMRGDDALVDRLIEDGMARVRAGGQDESPDLEASFLEEVSRVKRHHGRYAEAFDLAQRAVQLREKHWGGHHPLTSRARKRLADVYYKQRDFRSAESLATGVLDDLLTYFGPHHPDVAALHTLLGNIAWRRGSYDTAGAHFESAERIWAQIFGPADPRAIRAIEARAAVHVSAEQFATAWAELEPLLARPPGLGEESDARATLAGGAAEALVGIGRYEKASELFGFEIGELTRKEGGDNVHLGYPLIGLGRLELARGNARKAVDHCRAAVALWREHLGARHPKLSWAYACLGTAELESGHPKAAAQSLELALSLYDVDVDDPGNLAEIQFALARSLLHDDPVRARSLAAQSAELYSKLPAHRNHVGKVVAWQHQLARSEAQRGRP